MGHWSNILLKSHWKPNGTRRYLNSLYCAHTYTHKYIHIFFLTRTEIARHLSSDLDKIILNIFTHLQRKFFFKKLTQFISVRTGVQNIKNLDLRCHILGVPFFPKQSKAQTIRLIHSQIPAFCCLSSKLQTLPWNNF